MHQVLTKRTSCAQSFLFLPQVIGLPEPQFLPLRNGNTGLGVVRGGEALNQMTRVQYLAQCLAPSKCGSAGMVSSS